MSAPKPPCFEVVSESSIRQGDIFLDFPVFVPSSNPEHYEVGSSNTYDVETYDVVVMTPSCVLEQEKTQFAVICPHSPFQDLLKNNPEFFGKEGLLGMIKKRAMPAFHYLEECDIEDFTRGESIVFFDSVMRVPLKLMNEYTGGNRLRLTPTYLPLLAYDFGHYFAKPARP